MPTGVQLNSLNVTESKKDLMASSYELGESGKRKGCTPVEKLLAFIVVLALAVAIAACVAVAILAQRQAGQMGTKDEVIMTKPSTAAPTTEPVDSKICLTPDCVVAAARVYDAMDMTVNPCDDFFEYACGNWVKKHPIPEEKSSISQFSLLNDDLLIKLKAILEKPSPANEIEAITKAKHLYQSCLNEQKIEDRGLEPVQHIYALFGKWPLLQNSWNATGFDLIKLMISLRRYGTSPLVYHTVSTDLKNSTVRKLELDQPSFLMPGRDYYLSKANQSIPAIKTYLTKLAMALGAESEARVEQDVDDLLEFETLVANISVPREERRDYNKIYKLMTIKDLYTNISDKFDWMRLLSGMMNVSGVEIPINMDEPVVVYSVKYLRKFVDLIEETPPRVLANYVLSWVYKAAVGTLPKRIRDIRTEYNRVMFDVKQEKPRWKSCVGEANSNLGNAVGRLFVEDYFDETAKAVALDMISNIRNAFNNLLAEQDWMDEATRAVAKDKADDIEERIGYDSKAIKNDTYLNEKYKYLTFDPETYFENILNKSKASSIEKLKKLREKVDKTEWFASPAIVNAYYSPTRNTITFPAGILQPPFFSKNYPKAMNFGGIGVVIGHEITHGFDDTGKNLTKNGDLKTWWSDTVSDNFKQKGKCIVEQYSNFSVPEANMNLNGINTQGENIADNGGLRQAYTAYRAWVQKQGKEEEKLPGLKFTPNQLFFLNFGQIWCSSMLPKDAVYRILTGVHSPGKYRVLGTLQNVQEFSDAFNCGRSSFMNPDKKCRVW
ncbi:neprilysin-4-like [Liolophura sinensis]|uniref:neprilysin-4-like n=1 Tax=Liolophura sinensis TaxID=3198878 RepID=UPI003158CCE2